MTSLHLIDDEGHICDAGRVSTFVAAAVAPSRQAQTAVRSNPDAILRPVATNYRVVGVFGSQSTGKSTLLNLLFGCKFQTMDSTAGRSQTTKGAFLAAAFSGGRSRSSSFASHVDPATNAEQADAAAPAADAPLSPKLLVVDFEGTDGIERGEDQHLERQLSLFALSAADVLIVNMWANEVGRFNGANISLLRTVFEVNLHLFTPQHQRGENASEAERDGAKPTLLFVLRDHTNPSTLDKTVESLVKSLSKVWDGITKPQQFAESAMSDLFELRYCALPHYELQREAFDTAITDLRSWFTDAAGAKYLFPGRSTFRGIPLVDLPTYMHSCWETIASHKDLDIPTQRDYLAQQRCDETSTRIQGEFEQECVRLKGLIEQGDFIPRVHEQLQETLESTLASVHTDLKLYSSRIVKQSLEALRSRLEESIAHVVDAQVKAIALSVARSGDEAAMRAVDAVFSQTANILGAEWFNAVQSRLKASGSQASLRMNAEPRVFVGKFWFELRGTINSIASELATAVAAQKDGESTSKVAAVVATLDEHQSAELTTEIRKQLLGLVNSRLVASAREISTVMTKTFDRSLNVADGKPRFFSTVQGLHTAMGPARASGLLLLAALFVNRLDDEASDASANQLDFSLSDVSIQLAGAVIIPAASTSGDASSTSSSRSLAGGNSPSRLLEDHEVHRAFELFQQHCNFTMQMMVKQIEQSQQPVPAWMWGLLLFLGANEVYFVLTSPILLILTIAVVYFFFRHWVVAQWQKFEETGPQAVVLPLKGAFAYMHGQYTKHVAPVIGTPGASKKKE